MNHKTVVVLGLIIILALCLLSEYLGYQLKNPLCIVPGLIIGSGAIIVCIGELDEKD